MCVYLGGESPGSFTPGVDGVIGLNSATAFNTKLILFFPAQEAVFTGKKAGAFPGGSPQYGGRSDNDEEEAVHVATRAIKFIAFEPHCIAHIAVAAQRLGPN